MLFLVIILFVFCCYMLGHKTHEKKIKKQESANPFIASHKALMERDKYYNDYVRWCLDNNHVPLDETHYITEIENMNHISEHINAILREKNIKISK